MRIVSVSWNKKKSLKPTTNQKQIKTTQLKFINKFSQRFSVIIIYQTTEQVLNNLILVQQSEVITQPHSSKDMPFH